MRQRRQRPQLPRREPRRAQGRGRAQFEATNPDKADTLVAGKEPDRVFLTQPPKGYLKATKAVKATTEAPLEKLDDSSPALHAAAGSPQAHRRLSVWREIIHRVALGRSWRSSIAPKKQPLGALSPSASGEGEQSLRFRLERVCVGAGLARGARKSCRRALDFLTRVVTLSLGPAERGPCCR